MFEVVGVKPQKSTLLPYGRLCVLYQQFYFIDICGLTKISIKVAGVKVYQDKLETLDPRGKGVLETKLKQPSPCSNCMQ